MDRGAILLGRSEKDFSSVYGKHRDQQSYPVGVSRTVVERVMRERVAILTNDIQTSESLRTAESLMAAQISSLMCVPLIVVEKLLGVIYLDTSDPVVRFDMLNQPKDAPGGFDEHRWTVGLDYWITPRAVVKTAYEFDHQEGWTTDSGVRRVCRRSRAGRDYRGHGAVSIPRARQHAASRSIPRRDRRIDRSHPR